VVSRVVGHPTAARAWAPADARGSGRPGVPAYPEVPL